MGWCVKNKRRGAERLCKRLFILYLDDIKYDAPDDHRAKSCNILCHLKVARFNEAYPPLKPYYVDFIKKKPRRRSLFIINLPHIILPKKKEKKRKKEFSNSNPLLEKEKEIRSKMGVYLRAMRSVIETRASSLNPKKKKKTTVFELWHLQRLIPNAWRQRNRNTSLHNSISKAGRNTSKERNAWERVSFRYLSLSLLFLSAEFRGRGTRKGGKVKRCKKRGAEPISGRVVFHRCATAWGISSRSARSPTLINSGLAINSKSQSASIQPSRNRIRGP